MTDKLPPNLLALFAPRPPLRFLPAQDHPAQDRRTARISAVSEYLPALQEYKETDVYHPTESHQQRKDRLMLEKQQKADWITTEGVKQYKPKDDPKIPGDPLRTLFLARLSYDVTEKDLEAEFSRYGPIASIHIIHNTHVSPDAPKKKRMRGYAFIEFERARDMTTAYKSADGLRLKNRAILVDVERGRTVENWRPRRLGGGLGGRGYTKARPAAAPMGGFGPPSGPGGGRFGQQQGGFGGRPGGGFQGGRPGGFQGGGGGGGGRGGFQGGRGGGFGSGRGGIGYQSNGFGGPPDGAPAGPRGGFGQGGGGGGAGFGGRPGGGYQDRDRGFGGGGRPGGGYQDRDRDGGYGQRDDSRKRRFDGEGGGNDDRNKRRY